ncbi:MAG: NAD(P)H-dependent glycerol-3-phosphate dehydrogenase [bacterium]
MIGIIKAGAWGTAIGKIIAEKGYPVELYSSREEVVRDINKNHTNSRYLFGVDLPENMTASQDIVKVSSDKDYLLLAVPSLYLLETVKEIVNVPNIREGETLIGVLTKGFLPSPKGPQLIIETLEDYLPGSYRNNMVYISGPSHAEEVARGKLTGLISASLNGKHSILLRELLSSPTLMVFSSFDVVGVQICAAVKNVIAIAFGILDALTEFSESFGDNTESLLLAAGLNEIQKIGQTLGATHPETFTSIAGVGDLDVTCRSRYGRNRRFGREIILARIASRYRSLDELIENISNLGYMPEGVVACKYVHQLSIKHKLKLPISNGIHRILNREAEPFEAVKDILQNLTKTPIEGIFSKLNASENG